MNKNLNVKVVLFPIGVYDRDYLESLSDKHLSEIASKQKYQTWYSLKDFQNALNDDEVDDVNNKIRDINDDWSRIKWAFDPITKSSRTILGKYKKEKTLYEFYAG